VSMKSSPRPGSGIIKSAGAPRRLGLRPRVSGGGRIYASFAGLRSAPPRRIWPRRQERIDERIGEHRQKRRQAFAGCARLM
jgi:hypothetical protein